MKYTLVQLVLACANGDAQDRPLKILVKSPAGALVHGFPEEVPAIFNNSGPDTSGIAAQAHLRKIFSKQSKAWLVHAVLHKRAPVH